MTEAAPHSWSDRLQARLMAVLDAVWDAIEFSDDPAAIRKAREKARACGEMAATVRKIAAMAGVRRAAPTGGAFTVPPTREPQDQPARAIDRLKGGARGRL